MPVRYAAGDKNRWFYLSENDYKVPADLYFSELDGDWSVDGYDPDGIVRYGEPYDDDVQYDPEIYVGRLLCRNRVDIENWTKKVLKYEQNPGNGNTSYLTRSFIFHADEFQRFKQSALVVNALPQFEHTVISEQPSYNSAGIPTAPKGAQIISTINNNNYGLISNFTHSGPRGISTATQGENYQNCHNCAYNIYTRDDLDLDDELTYRSITETGNSIENLTNLDYPAVYYSIGCTTNPFDHDLYRTETDYNWGTAWLSVVSAGGPAFLGNTRYGLVTSSHYLYEDFATTLASNTTYHLGALEAISKSYTNSDYCRRSHNLVGCPETEIWTNSPSAFSILYSKNYSTLEVNARESGCIISVMDATNNGRTYFDVREGQYATFYNVPNDYLLTITKHNKIPLLINPSTIYIQNEDITLDKYVTATNILAGYNVTTSKPQGPVIIESGSSVTFDASNDVTIQDNFEVKLGAELAIK